MGCEFFALGLAWRTALLAALLVAGAELALRTHYYACLMVVALGALLVMAELVRYVKLLDRILEQFLDTLRDGERLRPSHRLLDRMEVALDRTAGALAEREFALQRQVSHWQALADTSPVALFLLEDGAPPRPVNRAAHSLPPLTAALEEAAGALSGRPTGSSVLVQTPAGRRMVAVGGIWSDGSARWQLIALHTADPTFDMVEVAAWQRLVRILAHEIMNSLTPIATLADSILPSVEALAADHPSARTADMSAAIEAIARRSRGLLGFVDRYRAVAALPVPHRRTVRLADLFDKVAQLLKATLEQRNVACHLEVEEAGLAVEADPDLLEQALINLILNAIDAVADKEAPAIAVRAQRDEDWLRLSVADNGAGFAPEARDNAFIPFFTTKPNGSGIGLTLVQQIVLAHHGNVEITAGEDGGAAVSLALPLA
ncbi:MAG TPA: ATP-binding protein [Magnetospirillaceae bacterium]|nr:ATP-binding protein [Magnetospirillaceae bacterium]